MTAMFPVLAAVASILDTLLGFYSFIVLAGVFLSGRFRPQGGQASPLVAFVEKASGPYLRFFRKLFYRGGMLDLSPMWALMALNMARSVLKLLAAGRLGLGAVVAVFYTTIWGSVFSVANIILIIVFAIRLGLESKADTRSAQAKDLMDQALRGLVYQIYRLFYKGKNVSDRRLVRTCLVVFVVLELVGWALEQTLARLFL